MPWLTSLPSPVRVTNQEYYEERTDPADNTKTQKRLRRLVVDEYRGLDQAFADSIVSAGFSASSATQWTSQRDGDGGAYTVTKTVDTIAGSWFDAGV